MQNKRNLSLNSNIKFFKIMICDIFNDIIIYIYINNQFLFSYKTLYLKSKKILFCNLFNKLN